MIEVKGTKTLLVPRQGVNSKWLDELQDLLSRTRCGEILRQQEDGPPSGLRVPKSAA